MKKINYFLAFFMLISLNFNFALATDNFKLHPYGDADSNAGLLVTAGTYTDAATAQKAIYHNDVASNWKFGTYETTTQKFSVYTDASAYWDGSQWGTVKNGGICPMVYEGHSFVNNTAFSPVVFFIAPADAIYKVNTNFEYQSSNGDTQGFTFFQFKAKGGTSVVDMNFGKSYTANSRKLTSNFFVNLHAGDTITFNQSYTVWGDPFCQWTKLEVLGNNLGAPFTATDATASGAYYNNYPAKNFKLHSSGDADSDAALLVAAATYGDAQTAEKAIYHNDVATPWKFGTFESTTKNFFVYTPANANWNGGAQWQTLNDGTSPLVWDGHSFQNNNGFSPVIFFVAPEAAIYKVSTKFEYQSGNGDTKGSTLFQFKAKGGTSVVNMNFGANYTANDRTHAQDFFVNLLAGDTITFNQACTVWGDPYCQWTKLQVTGDNNGVVFTPAEANASGFYFDNYVVVTDFSFLNAKIADSETLMGASTNKIGAYLANATTTFQSAIDAAKSFVLNQSGAPQLDINAQLATLSSAYTTFANSYVGLNNYRLYPYGDIVSDANVLVAAGTYGDTQTAEKALVHNDAASPWKFGNYETATQKFLIYTGTNSYWQGTQWVSAQTNGVSPIVWDGHSFVNNADFSPAFLFVAPVDAIFKVNTKFEYQSANGDTQGSTFFQFKANDGSSVVNMNFGANYTANDRTHESDFFVNLHAGDTIIFNQTATVWGDPFCQWTQLNVMRDNSGVAFTSTDATASGSYFNYYDVHTALNQSGVNNLKIIAIENGIRIITDRVAAVSVYNLAGMTVKKCIVNSDEVISLTQGAYIVKSGNTIQKVIVR